MVIQRGTDHAWLVPTDEPARMAFILVDGRFSEELQAVLPGDVDVFDRALEE